MYRTVLQNITKLRHSSVVRGDTIIAMVIPLACMGVLIEAYYRTDYQDADTSWEAQFKPSNACIDSYNNNNCHTVAEAITAPNTTKETISLSSDVETNCNTHTNRIVETLERDGIVIIPNAIPQSILLAVRENILSLQQQQQQQPAMNVPPYAFATSGNDTDVRQDKIIWIRNTIGISSLLDNNTGNDNSVLDSVEDVSGRSTNNKSVIGQDLEYCIRFVRGIPYALEQNGYTLSNEHRIPKQCQLSMYSGDNISSYQRHLDTCTSTIYELGLLEYLRLSDYRQRRITIILYLNESHRPIHHGGTLRCWVSNELPDSVLDDSNNNNSDNYGTENSIFHPSFDIQPTGGTLVIFQSQRVEHQVLPSSVDRYALTNWVNSATT